MEPLNAFPANGENPSDAGEYAAAPSTICIEIAARSALVRIDVDKSASHHLSQSEIAGDNPLTTFSLKSRLRSGGKAMAHWQRQSRSILGLAVLLSLLLVQTVSGLPFRQTRINLSPRMLYHNFGSILGAVLIGSRHVAGDLELLSALHQLATAHLQSDKAVSVSLTSAPSSSTQEMLCEHRPIPAPNVIDE
jgi:hypothetical protein